MKKYRYILLGWLIFAPSVWAADNLAVALQATLTRHPSLAGKRAEVDAKNYAGDVARAQRYPTVSSQLAVQDGAQPAVLRARQPIWAFGRIDSGIAYADADLTAEQADLIRVKRQLSEQTAVAYARVLGVSQRIKVADDNIASLDKLYQQIQRREQGQLASQADVRLAASRLIQAKSQKERLLGDLSIARSELFALTQIEVDTEQAVADNYTNLPTANELENLAQERSAEVQLKQQKINLARADIEREKKSVMPTVYLQADHLMNQHTAGKATNVGMIFEGSVDNLGLGAIGRSKVAGARLQAAMEELNATRNDIRRNVNNLNANRKLQQGLLSSQGASIKELEALLASYQRQYEAGQKSWLEVLNMQRELSDQRLQQVQAENDWLIFSLRLSALIGGLDVVVEEKK